MSDADIRRIVADLRKPKEIAQDYPVSVGCVRNIRCGTSSRTDFMNRIGDENVRSSVIEQPWDGRVRYYANGKWRMSRPRPPSPAHP